MRSERRSRAGTLLDLATSLWRWLDPERRWHSGDLQLVPGISYVCKVHSLGPGLRTLVFSHQDRYSLDAQMAAATATVLFFIDDRAEVRPVAPANVFWREDQHRFIERATSALDLPLIPSSSYRGPMWRVGSSRVSVPEMTSIGRGMVRALD